MNKRKKRRISKKINKFFKTYFLPMTILGFVFSILGIVFKYLSFDITSMVCFLIATLFCGLPILFRALMALKQKVVSIELLVSIAVIGAICIKEYQECAIVTFLFQFGMFLEQKTLDKTRGAIKDLVDMSPKKANKIISGNIEEIDADMVNVGDMLAVREGEMVACDGIITKGSGYFMEASITGEALPKEKSINDLIYAGTILESGNVEMKCTRAGEDTTFGKIITLVEEATDAKSPLDRAIDRFAKYYTPCVILIALLTLIFIRIFKGYYDIDTSITVLVLACPGALVIGSPIASVAGIGRGARDHIILKGGDSLHEFSKATTFVFDKTGTLTKGEASILNYKYFGDDFNNDLSLIASMEAKSLHPLGKAIIMLSQKNNLNLNNEIIIDTIKGKGIKTTLSNSRYLVGNLAFLEENNVIISNDQIKIINDYLKSGSSIILVSKNNELLFIFEIGDEIKDDAIEMLNSLRRSGAKRFIMLTGDNYESAKYVADKIGIKEFYANLLPEDKLNMIKKLKDSGENVTFVGDGINDTPSLALANTAVAMGSGTDIAIETSAVVLMRSSLSDLAYSYKLSKKIVLVSYENVFIAILTVVLLLIGLFMNFIHMSIGMLIHEGSIFIVILNAMRILLWRRK